VLAVLIYLFCYHFYRFILKNSFHRVNMCLQLKRSGVKSDRKRSSVEKSPRTKPDSSSVSSVNADILRVRRPLLQDDSSDDNALEAGQLATTHTQPPASDQAVSMSETTTKGDLSLPVSATAASASSVGMFLNPASYTIHIIQKQKD